MGSIYAGIDVGNQTGKVVLLRDDGTIAGRAVVEFADEAAIVAQKALAEALASAGLHWEDVKAAVATGVGRNGVTIAQRAVTEVSCDARGAVHLHPAARTIIDIGAEDARGMRCEPDGRVVDFVMNDKCASGAGVFIEAMAKALELSVAEMASLSLQSENEVDVNATCAVFAESEVVSLIHRRVAAADIARGILDSVALRTASMLRRVGVNDDVVFIGGAALNIGMRAALDRRLGRSVVVLEDPVIVGALGAALYAMEGAA